MFAVILCYEVFIILGQDDEITDEELLQLGDQLWNADHQQFLPSDISLSVDSEGR